MSSLLSQLQPADDPVFLRARYPAAVTALCVLVMLRMFIAVGAARRAYKVQYPSCTGPPEFERVYRAQVNQSEQLGLFLPLLWGFSMFVHAPLGGALGLFWLIVRIGYFRTYSNTSSIRILYKYTYPAYYVLIIFSVGLLLQTLRSFL